MMLRGIPFVLASLLAAAAVFAAEPAVAGLEEGDKVPQFTATDDQGQTWNSSDHIGKKVVVVYFYPADLTGGCTKQACSFRDDMSDLEQLGVEVVGVSGDTVENHQIFKKVHSLNYTLLADPEGKVAAVFGVPTKAGGTISREVDGQQLSLTRGVTASRWTYVIGADGKVAIKKTNVNAEEDSAEIAKAVKEMKAGGKKQKEKQKATKPAK